MGKKTRNPKNAPIKIENKSNLNRRISINSFFFFILFIIIGMNIMAGTYTIQFMGNTKPKIYMKTISEMVRFVRIAIFSINITINGEITIKINLVIVEHSISIIIFELILNWPVTNYNLDHIYL